VGPYVGLVPKQEDSGESQPQLGISKTGDTMLRKLLVGSAHYILGPFGPDTDLRRLPAPVVRARGKEREEESCGGGSTEAGGLVASTLGEWRGL
jgi:transposase